MSLLDILVWIALLGVLSLAAFFLFDKRNRPSA